MTDLQAIIERLEKLPPEERKSLEREVVAATANLKFIPNPGPQTEAWFCKADALLYGGAGGGGKSALLLGLGLCSHRRSLIMRRHYVDLHALIEETLHFNGTRDGYNGASPPRLRTKDGRLIEFGAVAQPGDEMHWQGQPHDGLFIDEAAQFLESQVRFLMGWVRPGKGVAEDQRCRTVLATNPPLGAEGQWLIPMFAPWLDPAFPVQAKPGELRWVITDREGKDRWVDGAAPVTLDDETYIPKSRTFIPASLKDNPFLNKAAYQATLDALPPEIRAAVRDGNFMAARKDHPWQVIPTAWVKAAQARWGPHPPQGVAMSSMGIDVAQGGSDETVVAYRYDGWYAPPVAQPGKSTPDGPSVAGLVVAHRRGNAAVVIDMGGGYGGSVKDHLVANGVAVVSHKGAETRGVGRTKDRQYGFVNRRSEMIWRFREALDPSQEGGSPIALPDDARLLADLTAPTFEVGPRGIKVETKEDLVKRLGRSPDRGDAVMMAWLAGPKGGELASHGERFRAEPTKPRVISQREHRRHGRSVPYTSYRRH